MTYSWRQAFLFMSHLPSPKSKLITKGSDTRVSQPHTADCSDWIILCPGEHSHAFSDVYQHPWSLTIRCQYYIPPPHPTPPSKQSKISPLVQNPHLSKLRTTVLHEPPSPPALPGCRQRPGRGGDHLTARLVGPGRREASLCGRLHNVKWKGSMPAG